MNQNICRCEKPARCDINGALCGMCHRCFLHLVSDPETVTDASLKETEQFDPKFLVTTEEFARDVEAYVKNTPTSEENWEKEFDNLFNTPSIARMLSGPTDPNLGRDMVRGMKFFISYLLTKERESSERQGHFRGFLEGKEKERNRIIAEIEGMLNPPKRGSNKGRPATKRLAYNRALKDLLSKLKEEGKETNG